MVLVSINLTPYFGQGPVYPSQTGFESDDCRSGLLVDIYSLCW